MSTTNLIPELAEGQIPCSTCGAPVWRARFGKGHDWRLVESAPLVHNPIAGKPKAVGRVAISMPLVKGEPILGYIVRRRTTLRLHACKPFSAGGGRKKAPAFEPPTVKPIGNVNDLVRDGGCK